MRDRRCRWPADDGLLAKPGPVTSEALACAVAPAWSSGASSINYGIKTGLNKAFIVGNETKEALIREDPRSAELLKPIVRGRDVHAYRVVWEDLWLIATFPAADVDIDEYPAIRRWLASFGRRIHQTGERLPGGIRARKRTQHAWWELQDSCAYYGEFGRPKILWPEISDEAAFALCRKQMFCNNKVYFLTVPSPEDLRYLYAVLSSDVIRWYGSQITVTTGAGAHSWFKYSVEAFPIPLRGNAVGSWPGLLSHAEEGDVCQTGSPTALAKQKTAVAKLYGLTNQEERLLGSLDASR